MVSKMRNETRIKSKSNHTKTYVIFKWNSLLSSPVQFWIHSRTNMRRLLLIMRLLLISGHLSVHTKLNLYKTLIHSIVLNGCYICTRCSILHVWEKRKLQSAFLKKIYSKTGRKEDQESTGLSMWNNTSNNWHWKWKLVVYCKRQINSIWW